MFDYYSMTKNYR